MKQRMQFFAKAPEIMKAVSALNKAVDECGLEASLLHLIKLRASQINGCAYCVDMHVKEARRDGLSEQWINLVCVWRESPLFDDRERAVLAWTEALTQIATRGAPDADYEALREHFSPEDMTKLSVAIGVINVWNRLCVGFRSQHPIDARRKAA